MKQDDARRAAWRDELRELQSRLDVETNERMEEMQRGMRAFKRRHAASEANLKQYLRQQSKDHQVFLKEMQERVGEMPYIWGGDPILETKERKQARTEAGLALKQQAKDYK